MANLRFESFCFYCLEYERSGIPEAEFPVRASLESWQLILPFRMRDLLNSNQLPPRAETNSQSKMSVYSRLTSVRGSWKYG